MSHEIFLSSRKVLVRQSINMRSHLGALRVLALCLLSGNHFKATRKYPMDDIFADTQVKINIGELSSSS